ncbi:MAG: ribosome biogenesis GTPase YlqF [Lachnospiraceae bacterium]
MHFQWYPGHMTKAKRMMQENIKLIDVVIELVDARIPLSSKNPDIDQLAQNKIRIIILNKCDLADPKKTELWEKYFKEKGYFVACANAQRGQGIKQVKQLLAEACKEKKARDAKRGIKNRPTRAMIAGIPNVGKSTFINSFTGKAATKTGNKPGVTKGKQWVKIGKDVELLDTPGLLWPKFEDQEVGLNLAYIGSIKEEILNISEISLELIGFLRENYEGLLQKRYDIEEEEDNVKVLEKIAIARCCKQKGDKPDLEKAASLLMDDFRSGKIGKITLEVPKEQ